MTANRLKPHTCPACAAQFMGAPNSVYCPVCRPKHRLQQQLDSQYRRARGRGRAVGSTSICESCGAEYTVNSGPQKYCEECGKRIDAERSRAIRYTTPEGKHKHVLASKRWAANNRDRQRKAVQKWYKANRDKIKGRRDMITYIVREYQVDGRDTAENLIYNRVINEFEIKANTLHGAKCMAVRDGVYLAPRGLFEKSEPDDMIAYRFEGKWHDC